MKKKKKEVQKPYLGYCPKYIVREEVYRDLWGLEGGWLKRFCIAMGWRLYCKKWLDCIAVWGKNCITGVALYCSLGVVAEIVLQVLYCREGGLMNCVAIH